MQQREELLEMQMAECCAPSLRTWGRELSLEMRWRGWYVDFKIPGRWGSGN
ncbi:unnamed protein product [Linum tenue]|uniref:Uncharacterized protein n=1 Tax=Linum tenue TaxID=586396 RepID=A0AAV0IAJ8_9ROSI|nr:unnamed protein product [Linum tenue]